MPGSSDPTGSRDGDQRNIVRYRALAEEVRLDLVSTHTSCMRQPGPLIPATFGRVAERAYDHYDKSGIDIAAAHA